MAFSHPSLYKHATFDHVHGAPDRDFFKPLSIIFLLYEQGAPDRDLFIPLSIKMQLLNTSMGLQTVTFHTPLYQNATFDHEHGAPDCDLFTPLSIKM